MALLLRKYGLLLGFCLLALGPVKAQITYEAGLLTGVTVPYTWDTGINRDPRYKVRYDLKFAPITFHIGYDKWGYGLMLDPGVINTGQYFNVINTQGGVVGVRKINMSYAQLPVGVKIHVIDLSFFKISVTASIAAAYLLSAEEHVQHDYSRLKFPEAVYPILPDGYVIDYDGVISPAQTHFDMLDNTDFNKFQVYGGLGIRSDWDVGERWRLVGDFRVNYGFIEPRTSAYLNQVKNNQTLYDLYGSRKDAFALVQVGICRTLDIDRHANLDKSSGLHNERYPSEKSYNKPANGSGHAPKAKKTKVATSGADGGDHPSKSSKARGSYSAPSNAPKRQKIKGHSAHKLERAGAHNKPVKRKKGSTIMIRKH